MSRIEMDAALGVEGSPKLEFECGISKKSREMESELITSETILPNQYDDLELEQDPIGLLESGMKTCRDRLDGFGQELKLLFVEINIISEFIREQFGVELINRVSQLRKHILDFDEIEELTKSLSTKSVRARRSNRQAAAKWGREQERRERLRERKNRFYNIEHENCSNDEIFGLRGQGNEFECKVEEGSEHPLQPFDTPEDVETDDEQLSADDEEGTPEKKYGRATKPVDLLSEDSESQSRRLKPSILRHRKQHLQPQSSSHEDDYSGNIDVDNSQSPPLPQPPKSSGRQRNKNRGLTSPSNRRGRGRPKKTTEEKLTSVLGKPPRQCDECGKILKGPGSLKSHMNMHADLRPYPCLEDGCGKRFRVKNKLSLHMMIHKGDKKEQCRFCGKLFYFAKDLARHERTHTGEKPNVCPVCSKSFNVKQHLTLHLRTHTGERPYQCPICEKWFSQANSLRIHKKIHVKAAEAVAAGPKTPKKSRTTARSKRRNITESKTATEGSSHDLVLRSGHDEKLYDNIDNIVTVMLPIPAGTRLNPAEIIEIHQTESTSSQKLTYRNMAEKGPSPDQGNQVQVITLNSEETQILDHVPEGWKLMTTSRQGGAGSSLAAVQFPIYGFEIQQNRLPVIASTSGTISLELQQAVHPQPLLPQSNSEASNRYFQEYSKE